MGLGPAGQGRPGAARLLDILFATVLLILAFQIFQAKFEFGRMLVLPPLETIVNQACGKGLLADAFPLNDPEFGNAALKRFIDRKDPCFSCENVSQFFMSFDSFPFFNNHRNIYLSMGLWLKAFGICWDNLRGYFFAVYFLTVISCYVLFRQVAGPVPSFIAAAGIIYSPLPIHYLPDPRSFFRFPLFVIFFVCLLRIARCRTNRISMALCFLTGAVVGVGMGFRSDLILAVPLFFICTAIMWLTSRELAARRFLPGALLFSFAFLLFAWNILPTQFGASRASHSFLLGISGDKFRDVGIVQFPCTTPVTGSDSSVERLVAAYRVQVAGDKDSGKEHVEATYDLYSSMLFSEYLKLFPADVLMRALVVVKHNLNIPLERGALAGLPARSFLEWVIPLCACICLLGALAGDWRRGLPLLICAGAMLPVTSLQWEERHFFYLEFAGYFFLCMACGWLGAGLRRAEHRGWPALPLARLGAMAAMAGISALVLAVALHLAGRAQEKAVSRLITLYSNAPKVDVPFRSVPAADGTAVLSMDFPEESLKQPMRFLEFRMFGPPPGTPETLYAIKAFYPGGHDDLATSYNAPPGVGEFSMYYPLFGGETGVELNAAAALGLKAVRLLEDPPHAPAMCTAVPGAAGK